MQQKIFFVIYKTGLNLISIIIFDSIRTGDERETNVKSRSTEAIEKGIIIRPQLENSIFLRDWNQSKITQKWINPEIQFLSRELCFCFQGHCGLSWNSNCRHSQICQWNSHENNEIAKRIILLYCVLYVIKVLIVWKLICEWKLHCYTIVILRPCNFKE